MRGCCVPRPTVGVARMRTIIYVTTTHTPEQNSWNKYKQVQPQQTTVKVKVKVEVNAGFPRGPSAQGREQTTTTTTNTPVHLFLPVTYATRSDTPVQYKKVPCGTVRTSTAQWSKRYAIWYASSASLCNQQDWGVCNWHYGQPTSSTSTHIRARNSGTICLHTVTPQGALFLGREGQFHIQATFTLFRLRAWPLRHCNNPRNIHWMCIGHCTPRSNTHALRVQPTRLGVYNRHCDQPTSSTSTHIWARNFATICLHTVTPRGTLFLGWEGQFHNRATFTLFRLRRTAKPKNYSTDALAKLLPPRQMCTNLNL